VSTVGHNERVAKRILRFRSRDGHKLTVTDDEGLRHRATLTKVEEQVSVREDGSFTFGFCKSCNWVGPARRARGKARRDAETHLPDCTGGGKVRIGVTQE
jgi:hypothetical protein